MTQAVTLAQMGNTNQTFRNRIINGAMVIDQRNAGASVTPTTSAYTVDRWQYQCSVASKMSVQQTPSATETGYVTRIAAGFTNYLALTTASAYTAGAAEVFELCQKIEGFNFSDMAWGTASAKTVTLSFWAYSSLTGTFSGSLTNSAGNRSYPFTYTISSANTWTQISVTLAGDTTGTWVGATNGTGALVYFDMGSGSNYRSTANSWQAGNYVGVTGAVSVIGTSGATFYITGVQLEAGTTATPFENRSYGVELALCQRYYYASGASIVYDWTYGTSSFTAWPLPVTMRTSPTITATTSSTQTGMYVMSLNYVGVYHSAVTGGYGSDLKATAEL